MMAAIEYTVDQTTSLIILSNAICYPIFKMIGHTCSVLESLSASPGWAFGKRNINQTFLNLNKSLLIPNNHYYIYYVITAIYLI